MNGFIVIFTNYSSLYAVDPTIRTQHRIPQIEEKNFIGFNEDTGHFESLHAIDESYRLYFAQDKITQKAFSAFVGSVDRERLFLLRHRLPNIEFEGVPQGNIKVGAHESTGPLYNDVLRIIGDSDGEKVARIFKTVFTHDPVLEVKLSLLSAILDGQTPDLDETLERYREAFETFEVAKTNDDPFSTEFQTAFENFRDSLEIC